MNCLTTLILFYLYFYTVYIFIFNPSLIGGGRPPLVGGSPPPILNLSNNCIFLVNQVSFRPSTITYIRARVSRARMYVPFLLKYYVK